MATRKSPGDFTGRVSQQAAEDAQEELKARQDQITMANQAEMEAIETEVFDPKSGASLGKFEVVEMEISHSAVGKKDADRVIIRVVEDVDDMVFGAGNHYSFKAGQKYSVATEIADHLDSCGYLLGRL